MGFRIGDLDVAPGTSGFGHLVGNHRGAGDLKIPITVVHGAEPGPVLGITAAVHGCEYAGVITCVTLGRDVDPKKLKGTLLLVPVANPPSFDTRTPFVNPIDGVNLNRVFPGNPYGTSSEQIAHALYQNVTLRSDVYIDLHSGDMYEEIPLHVGMHRVGDAALDAKAETLARLFDMNLLCIMGKGIDDVGATMETEGMTFAGLRSGLTSCGNAALAGKPAVLIEAGGMGTLDPHVVDLEVRGIHNVMRHLGMLADPPNTSLKHTPCYGMYIVKTKLGGLYLPDVACGDLVKKGQRLGEMIDIRGRRVAEFHSPMEGYVLMMYTTPVRASGETIVILGRLTEKPESH
jgi:predicted deacylase